MIFLAAKDAGTDVIQVIFVAQQRNLIRNVLNNASSDILNSQKDHEDEVLLTLNFKCQLEVF